MPKHPRHIRDLSDPLAEREEDYKQRREVKRLLHLHGSFDKVMGELERQRIRKLREGGPR